MMSGLIKFKQGDEEENVIAGCLDECPGEKQTLITRWFCIVPKDRYPLKIPNRNNPPHETPTPPSFPLDSATRTIYSYADI